MLRAHLERNHDLWTPSAFQACIQQYFDDPEHRPHEPDRFVEMLSRYRDWTPDEAHNVFMFAGYVKISWPQFANKYCKCVQNFSNKPG